MNAFAISVGMSALLVLLLVWFFLFPYRRYRVSVLRHYLFAARDQLFAAAARGDLAFDDRAYGIVRTVINGLLMKSDGLSLASFLIMRLAGATADLRESSEHFDNKLLAARGQLSPAGAAAVENAIAEIHFCVLTHILHISVIFGIPMQLLKIALRLCGIPAPSYRDWMAKRAGLAQHVEARLKELDRQAYAVGESRYNPPLPRAA
jgi:hypothetical protein